MTRSWWRAVFATLVVVATACGQPTAEDLPDGAEPIVPGVAADSLDLSEGQRILRATPRTPVGEIFDDVLRGQRAAEIVAAIGRDAPSGFLPGCTSEGDVILVLPEDELARGELVIFDAVRAVDDFLDVTKPEQVRTGELAAITCEATGRTLPR